MKKFPPVEKIYEAWSAITDGRVVLETNTASVTSSSRAKTYTVSWDGGIFSSNDNATHWQGYAGYPVIAVLMLQGRLPFDKNIASLFADINWTEANAAAKSDYAEAVDAVFTMLKLDEEQKGNVRAEALKAYAALMALDIEVKRQASRKPRGLANK